MQFICIWEIKKIQNIYYTHKLHTALCFHRSKASCRQSGNSTFTCLLSFQPHPHPHKLSDWKLLWLLLPNSGLVGSVLCLTLVTMKLNYLSCEEIKNFIYCRESPGRHRPRIYNKSMDLLLSKFICTYNEGAVNYFLWFIYVLFYMFSSQCYLVNAN